MTTNEQLEQTLEEMIAAGAGLQELEEALMAAGVTEEGTEPMDDQGRPVLPNASPRGYYNIRDHAMGDPLKATELAEWAIRKYKTVAHQETWVHDHASAQIAQIKEWEQQQTARLERQRKFWEGVLDQYMQDFHAGSKRVDLIHGTLRLKKCRATISWDEEAALRWALQQERVDDFAPRKISKSAIKAVLTKSGLQYVVSDTGEVVEFVRDVEPAQEYEFDVE